MNVTCQIFKLTDGYRELQLLTAATNSYNSESLSPPIRLYVINTSDRTLFFQFQFDMCRVAGYGKESASPSNISINNHNWFRCNKLNHPSFFFSFI